jgi:hypothetical protein
MVRSVQRYIIAVAGLFSVLAILACLARAMWANRLWNRRGFFIKKCEKISNEARILCVKTAHVHRSVSRDDLLDQEIKNTCLEIVNAADEYDTGICIGLAACEDMIHLSMRDSNV